MRLTGNNGAWIHYQLNQHPDHQRGASGSLNPVNNPAFPTYGKNYFENFSYWYFAWSKGAGGSTTPYTWYLDNVYLYTQTQPENEGVGALWVGYWTGRYWEIGFNDLSFPARDATTISTFEVRWSTSPITNENYGSANNITPQYFSYQTNKIRNPNQYAPYLWTRFTLPAGTETDNDKIYFAIKDVSATANGDGHDAPDNNIRTTDYTLRLPTTPAAFAFTDNTGVALSTVIGSTSIQVTGIDNTSPLSLSGAGCEYKINAGSWVSASDNVALNDNVALRVTSSASHNTAVSCVLTIGGVSDTWRVTTLAAVEDTQTPRFRGSSMSGGWR